MQTLVNQNRHRFLLFSPVLMAVGVVAGLQATTLRGPYLLTLLAILLFQLNRNRQGLPLYYLAGACLWVAIGWGAGYVKTTYLSTPPIQRSQPPKVMTAKVENMERTPYGLRLTLKDTQTQDRVRLTYLRKQPKDIQVGDTIQAKVKLMPHKREVYPGGFNFRLKNSYEGIVATGALLSDPEVLEDSAAQRSINKMRQSLNEALEQVLAGQTAMVAKALITGEKTGLSQKTRDTYAKAGVAHVLAISGLHLTLIAGFVFFLIRRLLCLIPIVAHHINQKKIAAACSVLMVFGYVLISGGSVPTIRAFIMFTVVMLGVILDRQALSMRTIMTAAVVVLLMRPESLLMPGFQLSFAAVLGLIAFYESCQEPLTRWLATDNILKKIWVYFLGILITTLIATFATLPFSIYHFHQFSLTGVFANLIIIPLMSFWIMPCILLFLTTGFDFAIQGAGHGIDLMSWTADYFAHLPGSEIFVPQLPKASLVLMGLGIVWLCLWQGRIRWVGFLFYIGAFAPLVWTQKPLVLVSEDAKLVGINTGQNLSISSPRTQSFVGKIWSESLGANPKGSVSWRKDPNARCDDAKNCMYKAGNVTVAYIKTVENITDYCTQADILISQEPLKRHRKVCNGPKVIIDRFDVWRHGTHIIIKDKGAFIVKTADGK